jgi:hypothetical protein
VLCLFKHRIVFIPFPSLIPPALHLRGIFPNLLRQTENNMNILVTGGSGFIGSHIVEHYHRTASVTVLDNFAPASVTTCRPFPSGSSKAASLTKPSCTI